MLQSLDGDVLQQLSEHSTASVSIGNASTDSIGFPANLLLPGSRQNSRPGSPFRGVGAGVSAGAASAASIAMAQGNMSKQFAEAMLAASQSQSHAHLQEGGPMEGGPMAGTMAHIDASGLDVRTRPENKDVLCPRFQDSLLA